MIDLFLNRNWFQDEKYGSWWQKSQGSSVVSVLLFSLKLRSSHFFIGSSCNDMHTILVTTESKKKLFNASINIEKCYRKINIYTDSYLLV